MMNNPCPTSTVITPLLPYSPLSSEREYGGRKMERTDYVINSTIWFNSQTTTKLTRTPNL